MAYIKKIQDPENTGFDISYEYITVGTKHVDHVAFNATALLLIHPNKAAAKATPKKKHILFGQVKIIDPAVFSLYFDDKSLSDAQQFYVLIKDLATAYTAFKPWSKYKDDVKTFLNSMVVYTASKNQYDAMVAEATSKGTTVAVQAPIAPVEPVEPTTTFSPAQLTLLQGASISHNWAEPADHGMYGHIGFFTDAASDR